MSESQSKKSAEGLQAAEAQIVELYRAIAAVDRFNPVYYRSVMGILVVLGGLSLGLAIFDYDQNLLRFMYFGFFGIFSFGLAFLSFSEERKYWGRWRRSVATLKRTLQEAEGLAGFGFVAVDKARGDEANLDQMKAKYLALSYAIREARERLGLKD